MKPLLRVCAIAILTLIASYVSFGQEWSKAQTEVWKVVESEWSAWKSGDMNTMANVLHEKYQGWNDTDPLPVSKKMVIEAFTAMKDTYKVNYASINPARIVVTDNSAVVDYFYMFSYSSGEGDQKKSMEHKGRIVEFYTKEGGKWQLLGDLMVDDQKEKED